jgi:hypothetical protein
VADFTETCRGLYDIMAWAEFLMSPPADDPGLDFEDFRRGTGRIFVTRQEWLSLLARAGFGGITCLPGPDSPPAWFGQYVFAARNSR